MRRVSKCAWEAGGGRNGDGGARVPAALERRAVADDGQDVGEEDDGAQHHEGDVHADAAAAEEGVAVGGDAKDLVAEARRRHAAAVHLHHEEGGGEEARGRGEERKLHHHKARGAVEPARVTQEARDALEALDVAHVKVVRVAAAVVDAQRARAQVLGAGERRVVAVEEGRRLREQLRLARLHLHARTCIPSAAPSGTRAAEEGREEPHVLAGAIDGSAHATPVAEALHEEARTVGAGRRRHARPRLRVGANSVVVLCRRRLCRQRVRGSGCRRAERRLKQVAPQLRQRQAAGGHALRL